MARKQRYVPPSPSPTLVFVTCRTIQGRYLFRPSPQLNDLFLGILGRVQRRYQLKLCGVCVLSSHFHLLLIVEDAQQLSRFMRDLKSKLAIEVNRLTGWRGTVFQRRYDSAMVTDEDGAQIERLLYILSNSVKEGLIERPQDWPGVHCVDALIDGEPMTGHWFNRSREYAARTQRQDFEPLRYATEEVVKFSPIPCWAHLPPEVYRARIQALVETVVAEAALERSRTGRPVEGVESILARDPQYRPTKLARSPAPLVHAATKAARKAFYEMYSWFVAAFRSAAEKLKQGDREARFPVGSFPPGLPFVAG
jgi:REP element-mobilizing transposase RayT